MDEEDSPIATVIQKNPSNNQLKEEIVLPENNGKLIIYFFKKNYLLCLAITLEIHEDPAFVEALKKLLKDHGRSIKPEALQSILKIVYEGGKKHE